MKKAKPTPRPAAAAAPTTAPPIATAFSIGVRGGAIGIAVTADKSVVDDFEDVDKESQIEDSSKVVGVDCGNGDDDDESVVELAYVPVLTVEASVVEAGV